jgi:predicted metal-dependent HD superfamily phosphohydrolase
VGDLARRWVEVVRRLGGDALAAQPPGDDLESAYGELGRSYHCAVHIRAVLADIDWLAAEFELVDPLLACTQAAGLAHDIVYRGNAGADEEASAAWVRQALHIAGVATDIGERTAALVMMTASHVAPDDDPGAMVLLDADLAILGSDPMAYAAYVVAVREEYAHVTPEQWREGRSQVLQSLDDRPSLYRTDRAKHRWERQARVNIQEELRSLR